MRIIQFTTFLALLTVPFLLPADSFEEQVTIDTGLSYDYLTPAESYKDWFGAEFRYTNRFRPSTAITATVGLSERDELFSWFTAGIYQDWTPRFYTYSALTASTPTHWMGRVRGDNDFYFKFGSELQYIFALGGTAVFYDNHREDYIISVGGIWYTKHIIADGRYFFNMSSPGDVWSDAGRLSLGIGTMGKSWTNITVGLGHQAYLSLSGQLEVTQDITSISATEQIWLKRNFGIKIGGGYHKIENGYERYNVSFGVFRQIP